MSEIAILAGLSATGSAATYVAWPFLTGKVSVREYIEAGPEEELWDRLVCLGERTRSALSELEQDSREGRIKVQDYQAAKKSYGKRLRRIEGYLDSLDAGRLPSRAAVASLEEEVLVDDGNSGPDADALDEAATFEEGGGSRSHELPGRAPSSWRPGGSRAVAICPACGHREEESDALFCGRCGTALACPSCGQPSRDAEASFCGRCGASLRPGESKRKP